MSNHPTSSRSKSIIVIGMVFIAGIGFAVLLNTGIAYSNRMDLCVSCHSLQLPYEEYRETRHFKNPSGVQATCADCHVQQEFIPKLHAKLMAVKDVYHEIMGTIDTPEKFEARRWEMANRVWDRMKATDSATCRSCHDFANMDLSEQSRTARSRHGAAQDRGQTCIDCHKGLAHRYPREPREDPPAAAAAEDAPAQSADPDAA
ncbi:butanol dehydrogenase [Thiocapsa imhoffii]|uniref:Cytochrome c-type protein n=1 Tax=Thiocapsa imhoffii TaxID=382777 RepID=A0A9X0WJM1_9GAMM|nr:NapC/NirT family cytochrome c [Thiocapsa imhoffii]MBK1645746.1 butanol dehydrogenase [Thiocapsa imhoffii]